MSEKTTWLGSSLKNKIGTILWAIGGICFLALGFLWFSFAAEVDGGGSLALVLILNAVLYIGITVGLIMTNNTCATFAKVWGVVLLVCTIAVIAELVLVLVFIANLIQNTIGFDIFSIIPLNEMIEPILGPWIIIPLLLVLAVVCTLLAMIFITVQPGKKSRLIALILCLLTGMFGGHCIYAKRNVGAVVRIIMTLTLILYPITAIIVFIDFIKICCGKFKDENKENITEWVVA